MKKLTLLKGSLALSIVATMVVSCSTPQMQVAGHYEHKTECIGVEGDGSQTVKGWGTGRNREDAIEQAKKNAVSDVLFKGIVGNNKGCNGKPVLFEVNIREKKEDYFNAFFADGGPYTEFITGEDGSDLHSSVVKGRGQAGDQELYGVIVRVQRAKLKAKMIQDGIMPK
jgi:hypothetical protein